MVSARTARAVYVLTTGGTMEKVYCERTGDVANVLKNEIHWLFGNFRGKGFLLRSASFLPLQ